MQKNPGILQDFRICSENPIECSACAVKQKIANEWFFFAISTFLERRVFLKNRSIEFHKIWQGDTSECGYLKDWNIFEV